MKYFILRIFIVKIFSKKVFILNFMRVYFPHYKIVFPVYNLWLFVLYFVFGLPYRTFLFSIWLLWNLLYQDNFCICFMPIFSNNIHKISFYIFSCWLLNIYILLHSILFCDWISQLNVLICLFKFSMNFERSENTIFYRKKLRTHWSLWTTSCRTSGEFQNLYISTMCNQLYHLLELIS